MVSDPILLAEFPERSANELGSIVRYQYPRNAKTGDNVFPHKFLGISVCNMYQWFRLDSFSEIICGHNEPLAVSRGFQERSHYIQSPLREWPWTCNRVEIGCRLVNRWSKLLTLIAFFHILGGILLHVRPPITLPYGTMCQRSSSDVPSTYPFVNLPQQILNGIRVNTT